MKLITRALIVIVIPFWGEPWHGTDSMVGKRGEVVVGAFERNISCGGGRQLPREWFKTRGEWSWGCHDVTTEAAEPINRALSHSLKGSHPPLPSTTTTSPSYSPPPSTLVPSFKPPGTKYQLFSQQSSPPSPTTSIQSWRKIILLVQSDNSKTATFFTIVLKFQTPATLNV